MATPTVTVSAGIGALVIILLINLFRWSVDFFCGPSEVDPEEEMLLNDIKRMIRDLERIKNNPYSVGGYKLSALIQERIEEKIIQYEGFISPHNEFNKTDTRAELVCRRVSEYYRTPLTKECCKEKLSQDHQEFCVSWELDSGLYDDYYIRRIQVYKNDAREKTAVKSNTGSYAVNDKFDKPPMRMGGIRGNVWLG